MSYTIFKHPAIRIDIMVEKSMWPALISYINACGCFYKEEFETENGFVRVKDIQATHPNKIGELIGAVYSMSMADPGKKYYILMNLRKKDTKNDKEHRETVDAGSEIRTERESTGDIESGQDLGHGGDGTECACTDLCGVREKVVETNDDSCE